MHNYPFSVAPMMACTDRYDRFFLRLISPHTLLYTEMMATEMLIYGDYARFLDFDVEEHPIALQIGGKDPLLLAKAAALGDAFHYDEINLNVGCPSDRVQKGQFGACLMLQPEVVVEGIIAMRERVKLPISVKCRIGVDHFDSLDHLIQFIEKLKNAGCSKFIIHARKAWLTGLSPKQNREVPPLRYEVVYEVKKCFPELNIIINGGIKTLNDIEEHLKQVDGVMIGREAYANPYFLTEIEKKYYPEVPILTRFEILEKLLPYVEKKLANNIKLSAITRHILGLFYKEKGGRLWRRNLSTNSSDNKADIQVLKDAIQSMYEAHG